MGRGTPTTPTKMEVKIKTGKGRGDALDSKPTGIARNVCRALLGTDGGEADGDGGLFADALEEVGHAVFLGDVGGGFEVAMSAGSFGVHHAFGLEWKRRRMRWGYG